jgi:hypothetical protein
MDSFLNWIDPDEHALEATKRIMAFFREKRILDELGFKQVVTGLSAQLFPGVSTVMTRLRYVFIIPWIYQYLEKKEVPSFKFGDEVAKMEKKLIPVLAAAEDNLGVIGLVAGQQLKTLPSELYWSVLGRWGFRTVKFTRNNYHRLVGKFYVRRRKCEALRKKAERQGEEIDRNILLSSVSWHTRLPKPPEGFPTDIDLTMTLPESEFIISRLKERYPNSLLCLLAQKPHDFTDVDAPWLHPDYHFFSADQRDLLTQARLLTEVISVANFLYFHQLLKLKNNHQLIETCESYFEQWLKHLPLDEIRVWGINNLWDLTIGRGYNVSYQSRIFIEKILNHVCTDPWGLLKNDNCLQLIKDREMRLKGPRSRFKNRKALDQWAANIQYHGVSFRWDTVRVILTDLYHGLNGGGLC